MKWMPSFIPKIPYLCLSCVHLHSLLEATSALPRGALRDTVKRAPVCHPLAPKWRLRRYYGGMATIQVKNVSDAAHAVLRQRAAAAGQSLQEYMLAWIERAAARPTVDEVL